MALAFRDGEALRVVLTSGLCPDDAPGRGARVGTGADGSIVLEPDQLLPPVALHQLRAVGVAVDAERPRDARRVRCWAEAVPPTRVPVPAIPSLLLLVTERTEGLVDLAAELLRLGCDRQELVVVGGLAAIRVVDAPTYTVLRALDREGDLVAFAPDPPDQEAVWTELGYRHPLADRLRVEPGTMLLVGRDRWRTLRDAGWQGLDAVLELIAPERAPALIAELPSRRTLELRLSSGRRVAPSLWVIRQGGVAAIDRLLEYLPEDVVARLTFAITGGDAPLAILRVRSGRHAPPELALAAEEHAPIADMPDVYAPAGAIVEPPLHRERLRAILGATGGDVLWLAPLPERRFRVERIADDAFRPLADWVEYVLHASAPALEPWLRSTALDFAPMVVAALPVPEPVSASPSEPRAERPARVRRPPPREEAAPPPPLAPPEVRGEPQAPAEMPVAAIRVDPELAALETEFVALDAPADAPERIALLDRLAAAYARLGRRRDAGLCFARAVWEAPPAEAAARLDRWIAADMRMRGGDGLVAIIDHGAPPADDVRLIAAVAARGAEDVRGTPLPAPVLRAVLGAPHRVQRWLEEHSAALDARSLWLSRLGLARLAGGDHLALAHARDFILARLAGGLPVEHELPAFLQFAGRSGVLGNASGEHLNAALEDIVTRVATTRRRRSFNEAPMELTGAYVQLQLAHGFARVGRHARARELAVHARTGLAAVAGDPVHAYLLAAFVARIEHAIVGVAPETALPAELGAQLAALDRLARFKVDRLREASRILEPLLRPDAFGVYIQGHGDARGPEFAELRRLEPWLRAERVMALIQRAAGAGDADRERLIDGILDALLDLGASTAVPLLDHAFPVIGHLPQARRAVLYARALVVAGHFGHARLVGELLELLGAAIRAAAGSDLDRVLLHSLRALRRIGLRREIAELLADAEHALVAAGPDALHARLALAAGLAFLGDAARALPIFDQAHAMLGSNMLPTARLELTRALALAYAQAPLGNALAGIGRLADGLHDITDSLATNSHYCLSVLHFVESLVLGVTSDDLALGEIGRRFVEDDEHLIRRRLHRDLGGLRDR
ncbi:MAG TPA: hypothetical protein VLM79_25100 [Kofleriaceae bacterium]|nr:hypothetical protein [Kofleriaceae bacterium]